MEKRDIEQSLEKLISSVDAASKDVMQLAELGDWEIQKLVGYQQDTNLNDYLS